MKAINLRTSLGFVICSAIAAVGQRVHAFTPIYGGPEYDAFTESGYLNPSQGYFSLVNGALLRGNSVNNSGLAVGTADRYYFGSGHNPRAVRWNSSTPPVELTPLGVSSSLSDSYAVAINSAGTTIGYAEKQLSGYRAVRWDASGIAPTELGHLGTDSSGITYSHAVALNQSGTAVGFAVKYDGGIEYGTRAVRWSAAGIAATELDHLGTDQNGRTDSRAYAINDSGVTVGAALFYDAGIEMGYRAVRWDASGTTATQLGHLGASLFDGLTESEAWAVNSSGTAIGWALKNGGSRETLQDHEVRAVRWDAGSIVATELGDLGLDFSGRTRTDARAINDSGTIVGDAIRYEPVTHANLGAAQSAGTTPARRPSS